MCVLSYSRWCQLVIRTVIASKVNNDTVLQYNKRYNRKIELNRKRTVLSMSSFVLPWKRHATGGKYKKYGTHQTLPSASVKGSEITWHKPNLLRCQFLPYRLPINNIPSANIPPMLKWNWFDPKKYTYRGVLLSELSKYWSTPGQKCQDGQKRHIIG